MPPLPPSPTFGVDVDGVVADLVRPLLDALSTRTGTRLRVDDITRFDLAGILGPSLWSTATDILASPGFALDLPLCPHAIEGVASLRTIGRVVFVTSPFPPSPTWAHDRFAWLARHFAATPADVVSAADKTLFRGDLLIDDSPAQLDAWTRLDRPAIRVAHPWNTDAPGIVASDWREIVRIVEDLMHAEPPSADSAVQA
jgi:5'(3')-deoxyribonucleotidase